jgi:hypothetical protein
VRNSARGLNMRLLRWPLLAHSDEVRCSPICRLSGVDRKFAAAVLIDANDPGCVKTRARSGSVEEPSLFAPRLEPQ